MRLLRAFVLGLTVAAPIASAQAGVVIPFDFQLASSSPPQGALSASAATLEITQIAPNKVGFLFVNTIDAPYDGATFLTALRLNYTGSLSASAVRGSAQAWTPGSTPAGFTLQAFNTGSFGGANGSISGYSGFDIQLSFPTSRNGNRFTDHEYYAWSFTGAGLDADDFLTGIDPNDPTRPDSPAMIHVQGIDGNPSSFWIVDSPQAVAEPDALPLFLAGMLGLGLLARRHSAKTARI